MTRREREMLVLAHSRWAWQIVRERARRHRWAWDDLHQDALLVLWRRTEHYDPERGSFAAFAGQEVRGAVLLALRRYLSPVGIGAGAGKRRALADCAPGIPLDGTVDRFHGPTPEELVAEAELPRAAARAISRLPARERAILDGRLAGRSVGDLAARLRVSHQRVAQISARAVRLVRAALGS